MRAATSVTEGGIGQSVAITTVLLGADTLVRTRFVQLSEGDEVSAQMGSTNCEGPPRRPRYNREKPTSGQCGEGRKEDLGGHS